MRSFVTARGAPDSVERLERAVRACGDAAVRVGRHQGAAAFGGATFVWCLPLE